MSEVAHFFVVVGGSKIHERPVHFFIDIYTSKKEQIIRILIMLIIILLSWFNSDDVVDLEIESFSVDDYNEEIAVFSSSSIVDPIDSSEDAVRAAKTIWIETYGYEVLKKMPYNVSFDEKNNIWLVMGSTNENHFGGVPYLLVHQDGRVIAVWHEK